jgi:hypothetical protein
MLVSCCCVFYIYSLFPTVTHNCGFLVLMLSEISYKFRVNFLIIRDCLSPWWWINGRIPARCNAGNSYYTRMLRSCRVYRKRVKRESVTVIILMLKLRQNSFVLSLSTSHSLITVGKFRRKSLVWYWCSSRNGNITADMRKRGQRKRV